MMMQNEILAGIDVSAAPKQPVQATWWLLWQILSWAVQQAQELGREHRPLIEAKALDAIESLAAWDIPGVGPFVEPAIDRMIRKSGPAILRQLLDSVLGADDADDPGGL